MTLATVVDESRKMADAVARSPSRLCGRVGKICCYGDALSTICVLACFRAMLPTFRFSFLFSFFSSTGIPRYVYLLRVPSSVQQLPATLGKYVFDGTCSFGLLCRLDPTPSRNSCVFSFVYSSSSTLDYLFRSSCFSSGVLWCALVHYSCTQLICLPWFFSLTVTTKYTSL